MIALHRALIELFLNLTSHNIPNKRTLIVLAFAERPMKKYICLKEKLILIKICLVLVNIHYYQILALKEKNSVYKVEHKINKVYYLNYIFYIIYYCFKFSLSFNKKKLSFIPLPTFGITL